MPCSDRRKSSLLAADDLHRDPHPVNDGFLNLKTGFLQGAADENRTAIHEIRKVPMRPLERLDEEALSTFLGNRHDDKPAAGSQNPPAFGQDGGHPRDGEQLQCERHQNAVHRLRLIGKRFRIAARHERPIAEVFFLQESLGSRDHILGNVDPGDLARRADLFGKPSPDCGRCHNRFPEYVRPAADSRSAIPLSRMGCSERSARRSYVLAILL